MYIMYVLYCFPFEHKIGFVLKIQLIAFII